MLKQFETIKTIQRPGIFRNFHWILSTDVVPQSTLLSKGLQTISFMLFSNKLRDLSYHMFSAWNIFSKNDSWMNEVIFWKHKWDLRNDTWKQPLVVLQQLLMCLSARTKAHLALSRLAVKRQENQQSFISTRALCAIYNRCSVLFSFFQRQRGLLGGGFSVSSKAFQQWG